MMDIVSLAASRLEGWDEALLMDVYAEALGGGEPSSGLVHRLDAVTTLLPPEAAPIIDYRYLKRVVPTTSKMSIWNQEAQTAAETLVYGYKNLSNTEIEELALKAWPARAKIDLALRRSRISDCLPAYREVNWLLKCSGLDYITVCNLLNSDLLLSEMEWSWIDFWIGLGALDADAVHFSDVAGVVNSLCKKHDVSGFPRLKVVECGGLIGYRNYPFPGFDVVEETRKLAGEVTERPGGAESWLEVFNGVAEAELVTPKDLGEWMPFREWVAAAEWQTAGASSVGRVEWEWDGAKGKSFKARKNLLPFVVDLAALAEEALTEWRGRQENYCIIKSELGKLRLAVASDVYTYLKMAWMSKLAGGFYLAWDGSTMDEGFWEQTTRIYNMLQDLNKRYQMPWDYKSFDHQPWLEEVVIIEKKKHKVARLTVPPEGLEEFDSIADDIESGFFNSVLYTPKQTWAERGKHMFKVVAGVESGLADTSKLGNAWNTVMTRVVWRWLQAGQVGISGMLEIRGDDTALSDSHYLRLLLFRLGYAVMGAEGADAKFGILRLRTELLRVSYEVKEGARGYAARALPGLMQRKPWSNTPWSDESVALTVAETARTLRRRGVNIARMDTWWRGWVASWARRKGVDDRWLMVPESVGGLGVTRWDGKSLPSGTWPKATLAVGDRLTVTNMQPGASALQEKRFKPVGPLTAQEAAKLAQVAATGRIVGDDIPTVSSELRATASVPKRGTFDPVPVRWTAAGYEALRRAMITMMALPADLSAEGWVVDHLQPGGGYGSFKTLRSTWRLIQELSRVREIRPMNEMRQRAPDFVAKVKTLERWGLSRAEVLDWLFGEITVGQCKQLHPAAVWILQLAVATVMAGFVGTTKFSRWGFTAVTVQAAAILENALLASKFVQRFYSW